MKKLIISALSFYVLLIFFPSCQHEETPSPIKGKVTFSLSQVTRSDGQGKETATPAFVVLDVEDSHGQVQENIKLPLLTFGQNYISENLDLQTGDYRITQFIVLDAVDEVIYVTPMEGSPLSQDVADPLPIEFTVTAGGIQVTPEVLAVVNTDEPELFGYTSFGFKIIDVHELQIPSAGAEKILKVSYEFSNGMETVKGEGIPENSILDFHNTTSLHRKTWETTLIVWMETEIEPEVEPCYQVSPFQKIYRFEGQLTFDGSIKKLPSFTNESWGAFYHKEITFGFDGTKSLQVFFPVDPRKSFLAEIYSQSLEAAYVDRVYYDEEWNQICDSDSDEKAGPGRIQIRFPDRTACENSEFGVLGLIHSFIIIKVEAWHVIAATFYWKVTADGSVKPYCFH
jgi:hypothetical protein